MTLIKIPVKVAVSGGEAPYTFVFSSTSSCVTFSKSTGTAALIDAQYVAATEARFTDQACIGSSFISVTFTDTNGCSKTLSPIAINNPCNITNTISSNGEFMFIATTTGGTGTYTYSWTFDDTLFTLSGTDISPTDNSLSLSLLTSIVPESTVISCLVTDTKGCTKYTSYTYNFCKPSIINGSVYLTCGFLSTCANSKSKHVNFNLSGLVSTCSNQTIDWEKTNFIVPADICVTNNNNGTITVASKSSSAITKNLLFAVITTSGVRANHGVLSVLAPTCATINNERTTVEPFTGVPTTVQIIASDTVGTVKIIPVESRVAGYPDWSSFTFLNSPSWGTVAFNADREIEYTITDITTTTNIPDTVVWKMNDIYGSQINITDTISRNVSGVPVTTGEVICTTCGETTAPVDVLANDTGDIDRSTLTIVLNDPDVVITKNSDNNLIFTVLPGVTGFSNACSYKVANTQGVYCSPQLFIVSTACAGIPTDLDLTCVPSKILNLQDRFANMLGLNWTWSETTTGSPTYASQGGVITGAQGTIDLTGMTNRTYTFELSVENTGSCPGIYDTETVSIVHAQSPNIVFVSATDNLNGTSTYNFEYTGVHLPFSVTLNGVLVDYFYPITASDGIGSFTIYNVTGVNSVVIQAQSVCGPSVTATDTSLNL